MTTEEVALMKAGAERITALGQALQSRDAEIARLRAELDRLKPSASCGCEEKNIACIHVAMTKPSGQVKAIGALIAAHDAVTSPDPDMMTRADTALSLLASQAQAAHVLAEVLWTCGSIVNGMWHTNDCINTRAEFPETKDCTQGCIEACSALALVRTT